MIFWGSGCAGRSHSSCKYGFTSWGTKIAHHLARWVGHVRSRWRTLVRMVYFIAEAKESIGSLPLPGIWPYAVCTPRSRKSNLREKPSWGFESWHHFENPKVPIYPQKLRKGDMENHKSNQLFCLWSWPQNGPSLLHRANCPPTLGGHGLPPCSHCKWRKVHRSDRSKTTFMCPHSHSAHACTGLNELVVARRPIDSQESRCWKPGEHPMFTVLFCLKVENSELVIQFELRITVLKAKAQRRPLITGTLKYDAMVSAYIHHFNPHVEDSIFFKIPFPKDFHLVHSGSQLWKGIPLVGWAKCLFFVSV